MKTFHVYLIAGPSQTDVPPIPIVVKADNYAAEKRQFGSNGVVDSIYLFWNGNDRNTGGVADFPKDKVLGIVQQ
ncbi:MAG: hypothetical protein K1X82_07385 [Bacteroidia bacterium]|nr:hypothetical protein [Bacteroidia bacterium]